MQFVVHMLYILVLQLGRVSRVALPKRYPMVVSGACDIVVIDFDPSQVGAACGFAICRFLLLHGLGPKKEPHVTQRR